MTRATAARWRIIGFLLHLRTYEHGAGMTVLASRAAAGARKPARTRIAEVFRANRMLPAGGCNLLAVGRSQSKRRGGPFGRRPSGSRTKRNPARRGRRGGIAAIRVAATRWHCRARAECSWTPGRDDRAGRELDGRAAPVAGIADPRRTAPIDRWHRARAGRRLHPPAAEAGEVRFRSGAALADPALAGRRADRR